MSAVKDNVAPPIPHQRAWSAIVASVPSDFSDRIYVTIPDYTGELRWGPLKWQSRDDVSMPRLGDTALVIFDNNRNPWVVAWWPFS